MHELDAALLETLPLVAVPRFGSFEPLKGAGERLLVASNGLFYEVKRPWMYAVAPLGMQHAVTIPYGEMAPQVAFTCGQVRYDSFGWFLEEARRVYPNEAAGMVVWNEATGQFRNIVLEAESVSGDEIHYRRPRLEDDEHLVVDVHSHGRLPAFFSDLDNSDDSSEVKVAAVFGEVMGDTQSLTARLCLNGLYKTLIERTLSINTEGALEGMPET